MIIWWWCLVKSVLEWNIGPVEFCSHSMRSAIQTVHNEICINCTVIIILLNVIALLTVLIVIIHNKNCINEKFLINLFHFSVCKDLKSGYF